MRSGSLPVRRRVLIAADLVVASMPDILTKVGA